MDASIWKRKKARIWLMFGLTEITIKKKPAELVAAGHFRQRQKICTEWIRALKTDRENADRITANDLTRHDQIVVRRKIKRFGTSDANINNDWQATRAGQKKKDYKDLAVRRMQMK